MICFARVASPYSLRNRRLVTLSHNRLLSLDCCFDIGRTFLGTTRNGVKSISVVQSASLFLLLAALALAEAVHQRTTLRQQPSK